MSKPEISGFKTPGTRFLSNMHPCQLEFDGIIYRCAESAYAAQKCLDPADRPQFASLDGYQAKRLGRRVAVRPDWEAVKLSVMRQILAVKFQPGSDMASLLLATEDAELIETNWWGDRFWGVCNGIGENHLGRLLMDQRETLRIERTL